MIKRVISLILIHSVFFCFFPPVAVSVGSERNGNCCKSNIKKKAVGKKTLPRRLVNKTSSRRKLAKKKVYAPAKPLAKTIGGNELSITNKPMALLDIVCTDAQRLVARVYYVSTVTQRIMLLNGKLVAKKQDDVWSEPVANDAVFAQKLVAVFSPKELEIYPKPEMGPEGTIYIKKDSWQAGEAQQIANIVQDRLGAEIQVNQIDIQNCP